MTPDNPFETPQEGVEVAGLGGNFLREVIKKMATRRLTPEERAAKGRIDFPGKESDQLDNAAPDGPEAPVEPPPPPPEATEAQTSNILMNEAEAVSDEKYAGNINLHRLDEPDGWNYVLETTAQDLAPQVDDARRGTITNEALQGMAAETGLTVDQLLARRTGDAWSAEHILAARQILVASRNKIAEQARRLRDMGGSDEDMVQFRQALARHQAIQMQVSGLAAEAGRALQQFRIMAEAGDLRNAEVKTALESGGGVGVVRAQAAAIADLVERGADPAKLNAAINNVAKATTLDMIQEYWINALLSSPATHGVNAASNALVTLWTTVERGLAAMNPGDGVAKGEAWASMYGLVEGWKDALRLAGHAMRTGEPSDPMGKIEARRFRAITAENVRALVSNKPAGMDLDPPDGPVGRAGALLDFGINGFGEVARLPGRFLMSADEFFKTIGYRMELRAQAFRKYGESPEADRMVADTLAYKQALSELEAEGKPFTEMDVASRAGIDIEQALLDGIPGVHIQADYTAHYNTFTKELGEGGKGFQSFLGRYPLARFIFPFIRTPINIMKFVGERTPLAPLSKAVRDELAAGGARRQVAMAKMEMGALTAASMSTMILANSDCLNSDFCITGMEPADPRERATWRREGIQPYSLKLGGTWHAYNRLDPIGWMIGAIADSVYIIDTANNDDVELDEISAAIVLGVSHNLVNKTYLQGVSDLMEIFTTYDREYVQRYLERFRGSFLPMSSAGRFAASVQDPYLREIDNYLEWRAANYLTPDKTLPVKRDFWGEPVQRSSGLFIRESTQKDSPVDREFRRLGWSPSKPRRQISGVDLTGAEYSELMRHFGEVQAPRYTSVLGVNVAGMNLKKALGAIIKGEQYKQLHEDVDFPGSKSDALNKVIGVYRKAAVDEFLQGDMSARVREEIRAREQMIMELNRQ